MNKFHKNLTKAKSVMNLISDNYLYRNFYKGSNGCFSYADYKYEEDNNYIFEINFGQQDDCYNTSYKILVSVPIEQDFDSKKIDFTEIEY
jgi:hypothetical protein